MKAMVLQNQGEPLVMQEWSRPEPGSDQILIKIDACAVCRTDLHVCDGDLKEPKLPLIPGHEIVGKVIAIGNKVKNFKIGDRVGVPWLGQTCGACHYCQTGKENLCDKARFTGYQIDGGYAEYTVAHQHYVFQLPVNMSDVEVAPLLCAGIIGYRAYKMAGKCNYLGLFGFGVAAHLTIQIARYYGIEVYAVTRPCDREGQAFAKDMGATWIGDADQVPANQLDAAIIYAPIGELVPAALKSIRKGGVVVCAGIHMSDIPSFPYHILWGERSIRSVANLTRQDGEEFLDLAARIPVKTETEEFVLANANIALNRLRNGQLKGAAVLVNQ